jgi:hypothetical protein
MADNKQTVEAHEHQRIEVRSWCPDCGKEIGRQTFNRADIQAQHATELPDREAMSLINADVAAPINAALALNVASDGSITNAVSQQMAPLNQVS